MSQTLLRHREVTATTGFQIQIKYVIYLLSAFVHPGQPV